MITLIAVLHQLDARTALDRLRQLLAPGGTLVIVGLARSGFPPTCLGRPPRSS
jgi:hypothetical protein